MEELLKFAHELFDTYESYSNHSITTSRFTQSDMLGWLQQYDGSNFLSKKIVGASAEGRTIHCYSLGNGATKVLLWSQMHGDEPTATMALVDILGWFHQHAEHPVAKLILEKLSLSMIPMLNPDGAERFTRRTAYHIDMNRDALALQTPEARILKRVRDEIEPMFGFNLHDQDPRLTVGNTKKIAAFAFLAPAIDERRSDNEVRIRAKHLASLLATIVGTFAPHSIARWDDTYEPRAFGDSIQRWGTSTVLVESGGWKGDPDKFAIRKLNAVSILTGLYAIATGAYQQAPLEIYEKIPFNTQYGFDVLIRNALFMPKGITVPVRVDVGINVEIVQQGVSDSYRRIARIMDVGDLSTYTAFEEIDGSSSMLDERYIYPDFSFPAEDVPLLLKKQKTNS